MDAEPLEDDAPEADAVLADELGIAAEEEAAPFSPLTSWTDDQGRCGQFLDTCPV